VPCGSVIDDVNGTDDWSVLVKSKGLPPPLNAMPLDQSTYNTMRTLYQGPLDRGNPALWIKEGLVRHILTAPGIVR
jgi:hypothetical protein